MLNDYKLDQYCKAIAEEICNSTTDIDEATDQVWEYADGSEYVIYYAKAHELCQNCNINEGTDFVEECYGDTFLSYDDLATQIAYAEIDSRIRAFVHEIFEEREEVAA